jgi:hypothetical protein
MKGFNGQSIQEMQLPFTTLRNSIPDGEPLSQEILSQCAELGASVQVSGQKLWRFQVIYHHSPDRCYESGLRHEVHGHYRLRVSAGVALLVVMQLRVRAVPHSHNGDW